MSVFFDANVLIYAYSRDARAETAKRALGGGGFISVQVINEFANVAHRKLGKSWAEIDDAIGNILAFTGPPVPITLQLNEQARHLAANHATAFYDALIIAAALGANCKTLLSEDMQAGRQFGELTIVNPFVLER